MKKFLSILFFSLFFLSQFGKVISFCYCTMDNFQHNGTVQCDCEKQLTVHTNETTDKNPFPTTNIVPHFDELFHQSFLSNSLLVAVANRQTVFHSFDEPLYHSYLVAVLRPPAA